MLSELSEAIERALTPVRELVTATITRAIVRNIDDRKAGQVADVSMTREDETIDVERAQPWGLSFVPPATGVLETVVMAVQSSLDNLVSFDIADRTHRPKGNHRKPGTGGFYGLKGWWLFRADDGKIRIGEDSVGSPGSDGAKADAGLEVSPDKSVKIGGVDAIETALLGTSAQSALDTFASALQAAATTAGGAAVPTDGGSVAMQSLATQIGLAATALSTALSAAQSQKVTLK